LTRHTKVFLIGLAACFYSFPSWGQQGKIDSILNVLPTFKEDTTKVNALNSLSEELIKIRDNNKATRYANDALLLSEKIQFENGKARAHNNMGNIYVNLGNYSEALIEYFTVLKLEEEAGNRKALVHSYGNIGSVYMTQGNYPEALKNYFSCLRISEEIKYKLGIAGSYSGLGNIYDKQGNYQEALKNYFSCLKINEELGNKQIIAATNHNIALIYSAHGDYPTALEKYFAALKINEEAGNKQWASNNYGGIGNVYYNQGKYDEALKNDLMALKIRQELGYKDGIAASYVNLGDVYIQLHKLEEARQYLMDGLSLSKKTGNKECVKASYSSLTRLDSLQGNWKSAYEHHKLFIIYRDSLFNEENIKKTVQAQMNFEFDKKEVITNEKNRKQKIVIWSVIGGLLLVIVFAGFIFRSLHITRKQKQLIEVQKTEVEKSKHIIEEKNKDITDSINYAKKIQEAKLPRKEEIYSALPQSFVLFKPKDIVSGDFYFFHKNDKTVFIASADCTGHGVPGALMSMIGSEKLVNALGYSTDTSEILKHLNKGIKVSLQQTGSNDSTRDGMDIALCSVDTANRIVHYSGANRPIWIIRKDRVEIIEIKPTKKAIGGFTEDDQHFDSHEIELQEGDTFYIFTDGFADQFGGTHGKKIMTKKFKEILLSIQDKSMQDQERFLDDFVEKWKSGIEQVDDILVIGVRL
jgi:serine phosphatase RsbU (regulator of sigma subunit)/Tfp pilus assembly protein PilF